MALSFPDDADGDALRRVERRGSDMSRPMKIDFMIDVPNQRAGEAIASRAEALGYMVKVVYDAGEAGTEDDVPSWTCYCTKRMLATYEGVVAVQVELEAISSPFGGHCDGWGTSGNQEAVQQ
jgi:hypothetical protein